MYYRIASGQRIQVNKEDIDYVKQFVWRINHTNGILYVIRRYNNKKFFLHREIAQRAGINGRVVRISKNKLDFRRSNLRQSQNNQVPFKNKISNAGHKGIYKDKGKYKVSTTTAPPKHIGYFKTLDEAIEVRDHYLKGPLKKNP